MKFTKILGIMFFTAALLITSRAMAGDTNVVTFELDDTTIVWVDDQGTSSFETDNKNVVKKFKKCTEGNNGKMEKAEFYECLKNSTFSYTSLTYDPSRKPGDYPDRAITHTGQVLWK